MGCDLMANVLLRIPSWRMKESAQDVKVPGILISLIHAEHFRSNAIPVQGENRTKSSIYLPISELIGSMPGFAV